MPQFTYQRFCYEYFYYKDVEIINSNAMVKRHIRKFYNVKNLRCSPPSGFLSPWQQIEEALP